jgi:hypothetical protein
MPTSDKGRTGRRFVGAVLATGAIAGALLLPAPAHAASASGAFVSPQPQPQHAVIDIDLFRAFRDCLAEAAHGDSMYPGIDPAEVNACLADHGF